MYSQQQHKNQSINHLINVCDAHFSSSKVDAYFIFQLIVCLKVQH